MSRHWLFAGARVTSRAARLYQWSPQPISRDGSPSREELQQDSSDFRANAEACAQGGAFRHSGIDSGEERGLVKVLRSGRFSIWAKQDFARIPCRYWRGVPKSSGPLPNHVRVEESHRQSAHQELERFPYFGNCLRHGRPCNSAI